MLEVENVPRHEVWRWSTIAERTSEIFGIYSAMVLSDLAQINLLAEAAGA